MKLPGGLEVTLRELGAAERKIETGEQRSGEGAALRELEPVPPPRPSFLAVADRDPNLVLAGLRIEIEMRLRSLARKHRLAEERSPILIARELAARGVVDPLTAVGLAQLIGAGERAAHGATVEEGAAVWAFEKGPEILALLDARIRSDG